MKIEITHEETGACKFERARVCVCMYVCMYVCVRVYRRVCCMSAISCSLRRCVSIVRICFQSTSVSFKKDFFFQKKIKEQIKEKLISYRTILNLQSEIMCYKAVEIIILQSITKLSTALL